MSASGRFVFWGVALLIPVAKAAERETLGPSSRRTPVVISEIMYHPLSPDGRNFEFVELYNPGVQVEDLTGWRLSGEINYVLLPGVGAKIVFPAGHRAQIQCKARLEDPLWTRVNGTRGYDAAADYEWVLDATNPGVRQRFYQAVAPP
jgi:hypothetical protein